MSSKRKYLAVEEKLLVIQVKFLFCKNTGLTNLIYTFILLKPDVTKCLTSRRKR